MPFLRIGQAVFEVTDPVGTRWAALEAEAVAAAAARPHGCPSLWFRTDEGGVGIVRVPQDRAQPSEGPATRPGVIVEVSVTHDGLSPSTEQQPETTDDEIADIVRGLKAELPNLDWDNTLSGRLLGPATPDRPDFPVWDYPDVAGSDPAVRLEHLTAARFPVRYPDGTISVVSVDEELRPMPAHLVGPPERVRGWDASAVIARYAALHDAGLLEWDPVERGLVRLGTIDDLRPVIEAWAAALRADAARD